MQFFKQKISSVIALIFVFVFGYFSIYLMNEVFSKYAQDEVSSQVAELKAERAQMERANWGFDPLPLLLIKYYAEGADLKSSPTYFTIYFNQKW